MERQRYGAGAQHHFSAIMHPRRLSGLRYELAGGKESLGVRCERSHEADRLLLDLRIFCWGSRKHSSPFLTVDFRHQSVRNWVWITTLTGLLVPTWEVIHNHNTSRTQPPRHYNCPRIIICFTQRITRRRLENSPRSLWDFRGSWSPFARQNLRDEKTAGKQTKKSLCGRRSHGQIAGFFSPCLFLWRSYLSDGPAGHGV